MLLQDAGGRVDCDADDFGRVDRVARYFVEVGEVGFRAVGVVTALKSRVHQH